MNICRIGKKLITSGSDAALNSIVATSITGSSLQLSNLGATDEILIVGINNEVTSSGVLSIDPTSKYVGINQENPEVTLHMTGEGAQSSQIRIEQYNDTADAPDIRTRKARGTEASPSAPNAGDYLFRQNIERYNGSGFETMHSQQFDLDGSDATKGVYQLQTNTGGGLITRYAINSDGNHQFTGSLAITSVVNAGTDTDKFLVLDSSNNVGFRTGAQVRSDIGAGTGDGTVTGTGANDQIAVWTNSSNIEGDSNFTWDGSIFNINGTGSVDLLRVDDRLQGNGPGFQFFAYNEDTIKVKFANWYSSNARQYGMGQLWFETWFAAIDNAANRDARRIGFYLEEPDAGSTDSGTPGQHPSNARFYVDIDGAYLSGSLDVDNGASITGSIALKGLDTSSTTKNFHVQTGNGTSIMDFRNDTYAFFGCGQGGGSASGFIFRYNSPGATQFAGYNYGNGTSPSYQPIYLDTDSAGRGQGIFINYASGSAPGSTEFAVRGTGTTSSTFTAKFQDSNSTDVFTILDNGDVRAAGDITAYYSSDKNLKTNIQPLENPIEKIKKVGGYTFDWKPESGKRGQDVGVVAQEIEAILPEVVTTRETGVKAVKYEKIIPLLIECIKDQQKQIDELKTLIK